MLKVPSRVHAFADTGFEQAKDRVVSSLQAEPSLIPFAITIATLVAVILLRPELSNVTPPLACSLLVWLVIQRVSSTRHLENSVTVGLLSPVTRSRVFFFFALEFAIFAWIRHVRPGNLSGMPATSFAILRYLVLAPPFVLMPLPFWVRFYKRYRAECLAAAIGLLTFYPYRLFAFAWPWYSRALGEVVYLLAHPFVPSIHLLFGTTPTLVGPGLDVSIIFACGGLEAIKLFQAIFALGLVLDWNALNHTRLIVAYFAGLAVTMVTNAIRIALLVIAGNRFSPDLVARYHLDAGWVFFALVFAALVLLTFAWLRSSGLPAYSRSAR